MPDDGSDLCLRGICCLAQLRRVHPLRVSNRGGVRVWRLAPPAQRALASEDADRGEAGHTRDEAAP